MANLSGNAPKDTYQSLLKLESNGMPSGSQVKTVEAGNGDDTALQLSDDAVRVNGTLQVTDATDFDGNVDINDTMTFPNGVTASSTELTGLLIDGNNQVVTREFHANAFDGQDATNSFSVITATGTNQVEATGPNQTLNLVAGNGINFVGNNSTKEITIDTTGLFQNPMIIGKFQGDAPVSTTIGKIPLTAINNATNDSSFGIKVGSEFSIDTANNEITVVNAGVIKIDVTLIVSVTTTHSTADVKAILFQENANGTADDFITVDEHLDGLSSNVQYRKAIHFSATRVSSANDTIYIKIKDTSTSSVSSMIVLTESNIKIEKLAS